MKKIRNCEFWVYIGVAVIVMVGVPVVLGLPKHSDASNSWADLGTVESAVTAIFGIPFVAYQVYCARLALSSQAIAAVYTPYVQLDQFFFEHHEFRSYVYGERFQPAKVLADDSSKDFQEQAESVAEFVTDTLYQAYCQKEAIGLRTFEPEIEYMISLFTHSSLLSDFLFKNQNWYQKEFVALVMTPATLEKCRQRATHRARPSASPAP